MVIFLILLLNDKRVISKERNTVRDSKLIRASLTWTDNTSKNGYATYSYRNRAIYELHYKFGSV